MRFLSHSTLAAYQVQKSEFDIIGIPVLSGLLRGTS